MSFLIFLLLLVDLHRQPDQRYQSGVIQGAVQAAIIGYTTQQMPGYGFQAVVGEMG